MEKMMYKIFLVEDEAVIRNGIKHSIPWAEHGLALVGEAGDGEMAWPLIRKERPDILITDIRMPFMDGLELTRLVRRELPGTKVLILSGYNDFDYAKSAIGLGVTDYLLKPINSAQLLEAIARVTGMLDEERERAELVERYRREMEEATSRDRNAFLQELVAGRMPLPELYEMAEQLGVNLSPAWHNFLLLKSRSVHHEEEEFSPSVVEVQEKVRDIAQREGCYLFERNLEGAAILLQADSEEELLALQSSLIEDVETVYRSYPQIRYFGGIGKSVCHLRELSMSFDHASRAFSHRFFTDENVILDSARLPDPGGRWEMEGSDHAISEVDPKEIDRERIRTFLKTGEEEEAVYFVEEFFGKISGSALQSTIFRQYITMDTYFCVADFLNSLQIGRDEIESPEAASGIFLDPDSALKYMIRIIRSAISLRDRAQGSRYRDVVEEALSFIEEQYAREDLSLNLVASHVNLSPNHLSVIFSQETGETFIRHLTGYRMNKARELLRCTNKRSSEISQEVGYRDPHYFSYLFKKTQGVTPTQYRSRRETGNAGGEMT